MSAPAMVAPIETGSIAIHIPTTSSITISEGSGIEVAGVGIEAADGTTSNTATVNLNLSAGQTPVQVIAYWEGFFPDGTVRPNTFDLDIEGVLLADVDLGRDAGHFMPLNHRVARIGMQPVEDVNI
mgnify:CR=1 FL=1